MMPQSEHYRSESATAYRIALVGPIASPGTPAAGGFEAANARLVMLLTALGLHPVTLPYPSVKDAGKLRKAWAYLTAFRSIEACIRRLPSGTILHITPLARQFLCYELRLVRVAAAHGLRVVVDLRAGDQQNEFEARGAYYKARYRALISCADAVFVEGQSYIPFVRSLRSNVSVTYLPNFLPNESLPEAPALRRAGEFRFTYVGAINEQKGVTYAVRLVRELSRRGHRVRFDLFGQAADRYVKLLQDETRMAPWLHLHGPQPFEIIRDTLAQTNFFIFLTTWRGEGHSNALTEAMSQGAIPIVTDHGFNMDVAGPDAIAVVDRTDIGKIAAQVEAIWSDPAESAACSARLVSRVRERYSATSVAATLSALYESVSL